MHGLQAAQRIATLGPSILSHSVAIVTSSHRSPCLNSGDEELVALAQAGDRGAFEQLVQRHEHKAYHVAFGFARDRETAKDLSQEAFLKAYKYLKRFDGKSSFYTWFYRIVVNVCLDYKRRDKRVRTDAFDETIENQIEPSHHSTKSMSPDQQVLAGQIARKVEAALQTLPAKQRTAFILKNSQGLSINEIAQLMETAEGTVKVHLHRAVTALRQRLAELA